MIAKVSLSDEQGGTYHITRDVKRIHKVDYPSHLYPSVFAGTTWKGSIRFRNTMTVYYKNGEWCSVCALLRKDYDTKAR